MNYKRGDHCNRRFYPGISPGHTVFPSYRFLDSQYLNSPLSVAKTSGVSLVELLVSLSVLAILIALSAPDMRALIVNNRVDNVASDLFGSLMLARSEAVKRQRTVSLCSTIDQSSCDETRSGWHHGWLVFTDAGDDGLLNGSDQLIRRVPAQSDAVSILWNNGDGVQFNSRGQSGRAGTFQICANEGGSGAKTIIVSMAGRVRTETQEACG